MRTSNSTQRAVPARRMVLAALAFAALVVASPVAAGANPIVPVISSVTVTLNAITVDWNLNVTGATSVDVVLYDQLGNVVTDDNVDVATTSDSFFSVANGDGYYVQVIANTSGGALTSASSAPLNVFVEGPPTIDTVDGATSSVSITWTSNAPSATGYDVTLYDANGDVVATHVMAASVTSDTFVAVPDAQGYYFQVVAHTPTGDLSSDLSAPFTLANSVFSNDFAPTFDGLQCTNGDLSVTWVNNTPDATGFDVVLLDGTGAVVAQHALDATATTDTFTAVPDGDGYTVKVIAHTPIGDFVAVSWSIRIVDGTIPQIPVDPPIHLGGGGVSGPFVVDPAAVTVTHLVGGGWSVRWTDIAEAGSTGFYVVSSDQGDNCTVQASGVVGTELSCVLEPSSDAVTPTGVSVSYNPDSSLYETQGTPGVEPEIGGVVYEKSPTPIPLPIIRHVPVPIDPTGSVAVVTSSNLASLWLLVSGAVLLAAIGSILFVFRRREPIE